MYIFLDKISLTYKNLIERFCIGFLEKKSFTFKKALPIVSFSVTQIVTDVETGAIQYQVSGPPFFIDDYIIEIKDLFYIYGDLYIFYIISVLLVFGSFNNFRKYYYTVSLLVVKIFTLLLLLLGFIYFQYFLIFIDTGFDYTLVLFDHLLTFDLNGLAFRLFVIGILCFTSIILFNYIVKYFILPFEYVLVLTCAIFGMFWFISSGNLALLFVALEAQALSFYILSSIKKNSSSSAEAGLKYFILGAFSSAFVLLSLFFFYLHFGTFSLYDLRIFATEFIQGMLTTHALHVESFGEKPYLHCGIDGIEFIGLVTRYCDIGFYYYDPCFMPFANNDMLVYFREVSIREYTLIYFYAFQFATIFLLTSLFFKLSAAPFHIWSPDVYEGAPLPVTQVFATLAKFVIFVLLIRLGLLFNFFNEDFFLINNFIRAVVVVSVIIGTFNALLEQRVKKFIAYSSITHTGYMLYGFSGGTLLCIDSSVSYLLGYMFLNCILWGMLLVLKQKKKLVTYLIEFSDLLSKNTKLTYIFTLIVSCMAGFPPFLFFYLKLKLFMSNGDDFLLFFLLICFTTFSAYYYLRIIKIIFFEQQVFLSMQNRVEVSSSLSFILVYGALILTVTSFSPWVLDTLSKLFIISFF